MRITSVETAPVDRHGRPSQLLILRSDTERVGVGELGPDRLRSGARPIDRALADLLIGRDPYNTQALLSDARERAPSSTLDLAFLAAAQTAMSDLIGRELGVPVHQLMGGRVRDRIRACAVDWMGDVGDATDVGAAARRAVAAGFTAIRVQPPSGPAIGSATFPVRVFELVRTIRGAVPDQVDLVVDVAGELTADDAVELAEALRGFEPMWLEDPLPPGSLDELRTLGHRLSVPLAGGRRLGQDGLHTLAVGGLVDHLVIDINAVGGLLEARSIAAIAEIWHIDVVPVAGDGTVALATTLQLAATIPNLSMVEVPLGSIPVQDGTIAVDLGPGLGSRATGIFEGEVTR